MYNVPAITTGPLWPIAEALFDIGWVGMVQGFALVLFSRLSILVLDWKARRRTLVMIIASAIIMHGTEIILTTTNPFTSFAKWKTALEVVERLQVTWFTLQEFFLMGLYIKAAWHHLYDPNSEDDNAYSRGTMRAVLFVQMMVAAINVALLMVELAGLFAIKGIILPFACAMKLELEFLALNQLVVMSRSQCDAANAFTREVFQDAEGTYGTFSGNPGSNAEQIELQRLGR